MAFIISSLKTLWQSKKMNEHKSAGETKNNIFENWWLFGISLIISAVLLFVCSKNSIIYPMNEWTDVNVFFSVKDSMFHGNVLYRDIFEHKGPFLYLVIYSLAHYLGDCYFTIYLFECFANALFVFFGTKIILLYDEDASRFKIFLYALCLEYCLCTAFAFLFGGTVEELYLWMSTYGLYITLRHLKSNQYYTAIELVLTGVLCGSIFWTKYSVLGFYAGLVLFVIYWNLTQKNWIRLGKTCLLFLSGFAITCIPELIYCLATHSLMDMINVYFIGNILGHHTSTYSSSYRYELCKEILMDFVLIIMSMSGLIATITKRYRNFMFLVIITLMTTILASCSLVSFHRNYIIQIFTFIPLGIAAYRLFTVRWIYKTIIASIILIVHLFISTEYCILHSPFIGIEPNVLFWQEYIRMVAKALIPVLFLCILANYKEQQHRPTISGIASVCILIVITIACYLIRDPIYFRKQSYPQMQFAKIIKQVENANILVYKMFDHGFFRVSGLYPQVKYFCSLELEPDDRNEERSNYIKDEIVDFIISPKQLSTEIDNTSYILIDSAIHYHYYNSEDMNFYLYGKSNVVHKINYNRP